MMNVVIWLFNVNLRFNVKSRLNYCATRLYDSTTACVRNWEIPFIGHLILIMNDFKKIWLSRYYDSKVKELRLRTYNDSLNTVYDSKTEYV